MPIIKVKASSDKPRTLTLLRTERMGDTCLLPAVRFPSDLNQEQEIDTWDTWEAREDDVILCSYPKSGCNWLWEIVSMLINGNHDPVKGWKRSSMLEVIPKTSFDSLPSPRVLNTHVYYSHLPENFKTKKCKIIIIMRNPKDVAVSLFHHHKGLKIYNYEGQWHDYLPRFLEGKVDYGSYFNYVANWKQELDSNTDHPMHLLTYESLQTDCVQEIRKLAKFLKVNENETLFEAIAEVCHFDKMKEGKVYPTHLWKENTEGFFRKGNVGDWKNWFCVEQNEVFDAAIQEKLGKVDMPFKYEMGYMEIS